MSTVTLAIQGFDCSGAAHPMPRVIHPVPRGAASDDNQQLLSRGAALSLALHLGLAVLVMAINYWPRSEIVGTPVEEVLDVTIIPLSALDTLLPQGAPVPPQPALNEPAVAPMVLPKRDSVKTKREQHSAPPRRIASSKMPEPTSSSTDFEDLSASNSTSIAVGRQASQQFGVANGEAIALESARISYQDMVATLIARAKRYPERALKRRITGEGSIRLEISSDGSLADLQILRSTDMPILDEELRAMVERAAPFPAFPSDLRKSRLALVVPIAFRLNSL